MKKVTREEILRKSLWQNKVTYAGAIVAVLAFLFFVSFQFLEYVLPGSSPYSGLWSFLVLPTFLTIGLLLIPAGYLFERHSRRQRFPDITHWPRFPRLDLNDKKQQRAFAVWGVGTLFVIPLIGVSSYEGYHYTDSVQFCGQVCHSVMHPEHTAYAGSPHARVTCAACHIGPGASWFVKSKISGVRQVFAVAFNTYSRPIPTPVHDLRPARQTCEQCHWPEKFYGSQVRHIPVYSSDEKNTRRDLQMVLKTGGAGSISSPPSGIHWHIATGDQIEYIADETRQKIPWIRSVETSGKETIYRSDGRGASDPPPAGERRRIDCVDCHNRPTHILHPPERAVGMSLEGGRIDRTLPYIKRYALEALTQPYPNEEAASSGISKHINEAYLKLDAKLLSERKSTIDQAIRELQIIYGRNFFPRMRASWRSYPENIGHFYYDGCFRCHDGKHVSNSGSSIRRDCALCHEFQEPVEGSPGSFRAIPPVHPYKLEGAHSTLNCSSCHNGGASPAPTCEGCHTLELKFRKGTSPLLAGMNPTPPAAMVEVGCDSCHDLAKGPAAKTAAAQCEACHEKGYGEMVESWKSDARSTRAKAAAAIEDLRKRLNAVPADSRRLADQLQLALEQVDRAGPHHNTELTDAVHKRIVELASEKK